MHPGCWGCCGSDLLSYQREALAKSEARSLDVYALRRCARAPDAGRDGGPEGGGSEAHSLKSSSVKAARAHPS